MRPSLLSRGGGRQGWIPAGTCTASWSSRGFLSGEAAVQRVSLAGPAARKEPKPPTRRRDWCRPWQEQWGLQPLPPSFSKVRIYLPAQGQQTVKRQRQNPL